MRKLILLAATLALVLVAVVPAIAQVGQEFEEEDVESGDVEPAVGIANKGDNVNLCAAVLQQAQSGNVQNEQGVTQYTTEGDDIEFEGSTIEIIPELEQECTQTIEQAAAAATQPTPPQPPPGLPDLVPVPTGALGTLPGTAIPIIGCNEITVMNQGTADAPASILTVQFLVGDATPFTPFGLGVPFGPPVPVATPPLAPGESVVLSLPPAPAEVIDPNVDLDATIDAGDQVTESEERNNFARGFCLA